VNSSENARFAGASSDSGTRRAIDREKAWGEDETYRQSMMDALGIWLSSVQIGRSLGPWSGKAIADLGCGHHATFSRKLLEQVASATLVDLSLSAELKAHPRVKALEGALPDVLGGVASASIDRVICNNVLEHLWEPLVMLEHVRRMLKPGGKCFINVPSWRGKRVLETAAFQLEFTSKAEIDDHKAYYDRRELWSLLVKSGFKPSQITCRSHKLGLNTYAVCTKE
jgi:2-polyprenyl-3-methyl-5-hydroxy-6-metoxy-1,4-benzoquinol methylase